MADRLITGLRLLVLGGVLLAGVGLIGHAVGSVWLTTTTGPTAYLLLAHPDTAGSRLRSAVAGHTAAVACGLAALAAFGLWNHPSIVEQRHDTLTQIAAQAIAVGCTLLALAVLDAHHPPAAATALLIASGIARPGAPLYGMLAGLALTLAGAFAGGKLTALSARRS
ncbi:HPP family protein [Actinocrinis puniceicyclus]|uniref:HPP family protein n=1 Tax=Actinocrinis puniceicyclus TaxID=977794 RepID=A0A8J8BCN6_9ACTN|nr:HPP family protein [Actinocrinis puniceicyclus]MBS2964373.1 HPP family protein [Actinocrinis puniceicyclus]